MELRNNVDNSSMFYFERTIIHERLNLFSSRRCSVHCAADGLSQNLGKINKMIIP